MPELSQISDPSSNSLSARAVKDELVLDLFDAEVIAELAGKRAPEIECDALKITVDRFCHFECSRVGVGTVTVAGAALASSSVMGGSNPLVEAA